MAYRFEDFESTYIREIHQTEYEKWEPFLREAHERIEKTMRKIMKKHPFYAALAAEMDIRVSPAVSTAATNGEMIIFHPTFFADLSPKERMFTLIHEIDHNANLHSVRYGEAEDMQPEVWNIACDYAINANLRNANQMELPNEALYKQAYTGWGAEHIYTDLMNNTVLPNRLKLPSDSRFGKKGDIVSRIRLTYGEDEDPHETTINLDKTRAEYEQGEKSGKKQQPGDIPDDVTRPGIGNKPGEHQRIERKMKKLVEQAILSTGAIYKQQGRTLPYERASIEDGGEKLSLAARLKNAYLTLTGTDNFTFRHPNRRMMNYDMYLPSMYSTRSSSIVMGIDNSGSISESQLHSFSDAVNALMIEMQIQDLKILHCDTQVNLEEDIKITDLPYEIKSRSGGGTCFRPVFRRIKELDLQPDLVFYFTDLHCYDMSDADEEDFPYPIIWIYSNGGYGPQLGHFNYPLSRDRFAEIYSEKMVKVRLGHSSKTNLPDYYVDPVTSKKYKSSYKQQLKTTLPTVGMFMNLEDDIDAKGR